MRGKRYEPATEEEDEGITPADAGKTERPAGDSSAPRDHPRGCGENFFERYILGNWVRITPADAGKTAGL